MRQDLASHDRSPRVYVIHENDEWVAPLRDELAQFLHDHKNDAQRASVQETRS